MGRPSKMPSFDNGRLRAVPCADCGKTGPQAVTAADARLLARAEGWSRCYRGSGEAFRCPECRAR